MYIYWNLPLCSPFYDDALETLFFTQRLIGAPQLLCNIRFIKRVCYRRIEFIFIKKNRDQSLESAGWKYVLREREASRGLWNSFSCSSVIWRGLRLFNNSASAQKWVVVVHHAISRPYPHLINANKKIIILFIRAGRPAMIPGPHFQISIGPAADCQQQQPCCQLKPGSNLIYCFYIFLLSNLLSVAVCCVRARTPSYSLALCNFTLQQHARPVHWNSSSDKVVVVEIFAAAAGGFNSQITPGMICSSVIGRLSVFHMIRPAGRPTALENNKIFLNVTLIRQQRSCFFLLLI